MHSIASLNLRRADSDQPNLQTPRRASFTFPERFKDGEDADIDVIAPKTRRVRYINQSFLSMIANVGSNNPPEPQAGLAEHPLHNDFEEHGLRAKTTQSIADLRGRLPSHRQDDAPQSQASEHIGSRMVRSTVNLASQPLPSQAIREPQVKYEEGDMTASQILPPRPEDMVKPRRIDSDAVEVVPSEVSDNQAGGRLSMNLTASMPSATSEEAAQPCVDLAARVAEVFGLAAAEDIIAGLYCLIQGDRSHTDSGAEMPCWLVQNVVVNGRIYVTQKHVCFYAFLPRKTVCQSLTYMIAPMLTCKLGYCDQIWVLPQARA